MDLEELKFMSLSSILLASITHILDRNNIKLYTQITLFFILPISVFFLLQIQIIQSLFMKTALEKAALDLAPSSSTSETRLNHLLDSYVDSYIIFKAIYLYLLLVFSLLATSAVVFTVASIFTSKTLTLKKVLSVIPKVWKRLMNTFMQAFWLYLAYNGASLLALRIPLHYYEPGEKFAVFLASVVLLVYLAGLAWISAIWQVANVVAVLEDIKVDDAFEKSWKLIKGKRLLAFRISMMLTLSFFAIELAYRMILLEGKGIGVIVKIGAVLVLLALLVVVTLVGMVVQILVYFVCKSYHHESIDKTNLADHLDVYLGEYEPLKEKQVQMESV